MALNCAQGHFGVKPDLTTLGKVIGGGMPVGAFGGSAAIMNHIAPDGPVYQAGTLSGNPIAMAAGLATLEAISAPNFFEDLTSKTAVLLKGLKEKADAAGIPFITQQAGGMFGLFFTDNDKVSSFAEVMACDADRFKKFFHLMLDRGIYLAPSAFEAGFVSAAHSEADLETTINAAAESFGEL